MVTDEADEYSEALPAMTIDIVRTGRGDGPNTVSSRVAGGVTIAHASTQFPMVGRAVIPDDTIYVALVTSAPPGTRWCGMDLEDSSLLLYGPGSEHSGVSPAGVESTFATVSIQELEESAEHSEIDIRVPERGRVVSPSPTPDARMLAEMLRGNGDQLNDGGLSPENDDILWSIGTMLAGGSGAGPNVRRRMIDSRSIAFAAVDYVITQELMADVGGVVGRRPTIPELCSVVHSSERRLRNAFYDTFGVAPLRFFRLRSMTLARRRLLQAKERDETVPEIAISLGYDHISRFASYYSDVYGESPSATVATR